MAFRARSKEHLAKLLVAAAISHGEIQIAFPNSSNISHIEVNANNGKLGGYLVFNSVGDIMVDVGIFAYDGEDIDEDDSIRFQTTKFDNIGLFIQRLMRRIPEIDFSVLCDDGDGSQSKKYIKTNINTDEPLKNLF